MELSGEYANWTDDDFRRNNGKRAALGITFDRTTTVMVAPGRARHAVADPSERERFLADIRSLLPIMERIDCPALSVMSGNVVPGLSPQAQHDSCVEGLKRAAELVEGENVTILLENVDLEENPRYYAWSISESAKITEEVGHPQVKVLYNLYHGQVSGGNLIANLERHLDQIALVQIGDVPGHHEPGTGEINYLNIYKKLGELKYDRYVAMEFFPTWTRSTSWPERAKKPCKQSEVDLAMALAADSGGRLRGWLCSLSSEVGRVQGYPHNAVPSDHPENISMEAPGCH